MRSKVRTFAAVALAWVAATAAAEEIQNVQVGPRPFYLVEQMSPGRLKRALQACSENTNVVSDFSIGHRGATLQFPEHTKESYEAAARMGAGIIECDVTFTADGELVCRHSECDLHTTTNILMYTDMAQKCSSPPDFSSDKPFENVRCCTSDITLDEFEMLSGKMDASDPNATTVEEYMGGTANWRTDLYATGGTLVTHAESIQLIRDMGAKFTPELKGGDAARIQAIFGGQEAYAQKMIDEYKDAGVDPSEVWAQSFDFDDVVYWVNNEPDFGEQAVWLDGRYSVPGFDPQKKKTWVNPSPQEILDAGVNIIAPPMPFLLKVNGNGKIAPSRYARQHRALGLDIISWTLERSGRIREDVVEGGNTFYYSTTLPALENDGAIMETIDVLAKKVGILGLFTDWPGTVTYYANCMGLE